MAPNDYGSHSGETFYRVLTRAIADLTENGFDSAERLAYWIAQIREAAVRSMTPPHILERALNDTLRSVYRSKIDGSEILRLHPGIARFTLERVKPRLHAELERRIMASANLIKLNRVSAIEKTIQRFSGWATSVPPGGTDAAKKVEVKATVRKAVASLPFEERRVLIDQSNKLVSNLSQILATDGGAIAGQWHSRWRQRNYDYREDHKERDGRIYIVRGNWALERGLMKVDGHEYTDDITAPGEEIFCRCSMRWLYSLRSLPGELITQKGRDELARVQITA
jgi:hypothetical protein